MLNQMDKTLKYLITGMGGLALGVGAGAIWNEVDKKKPSAKNSTTKSSYSAIVRADPQLVNAIDQLKGLGTIKPVDRGALVDAIEELGKHWMSVEATDPDKLASDAAFQAASLYENVHKSLDYMLEHSGVPMSNGQPASYEMRKIYGQILRSCSNWKHNATIAAQSKKRYL